MRVNIYSQELTSEAHLIRKVSNTGITYSAVQFMLHSQSDDAVFQVGTLTLKPGYNPGTTWIVQSSGEGGEFPTDKIEAVLQAYYKESF